MKRCSSIFMIIFVISSSILYASPSEKDRLVIFDLDRITNTVTEYESAILSDYIRIAFIKTQVFDILSREQLETVLKEYEFQLSGLTDESSVILIGHMLNVKNAVMGTIGKFGETYIVNIKLLNIETGKYYAAEEIRAKLKDEVLDLINIRVNMIATRIQYNTDANRALPITPGNKTVQMPSPAREISRTAETLQVRIEVSFGTSLVTMIHDATEESIESLALYFDIHALYPVQTGLILSASIGDAFFSYENSTENWKYNSTLLTIGIGYGYKFKNIMVYAAGLLGMISLDYDFIGGNGNYYGIDIGIDWYIGNFVVGSRYQYIDTDLFLDVKTLLISAGIRL